LEKPTELARNNYNRLSRWYDLFSGSERRFTEAGLRMLNAQPGEKVLEIGCGTGLSLLALARTVGQSGLVHGIDISEGMLRVASARIQKAGLLKVVNLRLGDAQHLPFEDASFDAVFMSFTLELFDDAGIQRVLGECARVLRKGGRVGVVSLAKKECRAVKIYEWFHSRLPAIVDCRPILVRQAFTASGFEIREVCEKAMWGLPVEIAVAVQPQRKSTAKEQRTRGYIMANEKRTSLSPSAQKVQDALRVNGFPCTVIEFVDSTRTSAEAAARVGCTLGQIAKSLVFRGQDSGRPVLVITSGANRVDEAKVGKLLGEPIGRADAEFVRASTGFAIGGVPPLGHSQPIVTFIDEDLLQYENIWGAAGTPNAVFELTPGELQKMTGGKVAHVK
jgi:ubiquinone/menaquinone biosynthesis C-methylase UbiE/prolyl-tRNA editing enzyme YbaK/EbsC (Cys-tRNA(Pro) deacylase)